VLLVAGAVASPFGRAMQAVRTGQLAAAPGIPVVRVKLAAFTFSTAAAALSGGLLAFYLRFPSPETVGGGRLERTKRDRAAWHADAVRSGRAA